MSGIEKLPANGKTTIYDNDGTTRVPKDIRENTDISKGDTLLWVCEDGVIKVKKI